MRLILFVLTIALAFWANAEDCVKVPDLSSGLGPVFHQRQFSWCHSYTATDLLTYKLQKMGKIKPGQRLHPLATLAVLTLETGRSPDSSRSTPDTVENNLRTLAAWDSEGGALCLEKDIGTARYIRNPIAIRSTDAQASILRKYFQYDDGKVRFREGMEPKCDGGQKGQLDTILNEMKAIERKVWIDEINRRCHTRMPAIHWEWKYDPRWTDEISGKLKEPPDPQRETIIKNEIDKSLANGAIIAIEYKPDFMVRRRWQNQGNHWSSIVGRELRNDGQCYYKIRNSWGTGCSAYKLPRNCSAGYIWVKQNELIKNTDATLFLD